MYTKYFMHVWVELAVVVCTTNDSVWCMRLNTGARMDAQYLWRERC